uniref:Golgin subfamily A member 7/ERF4 domain-containing protein n=1 Tax=Callithrix jacchus TaxID=9483 RepID=A0A8I3WRD3_CALJA
MQIQACRSRGSGRSGREEPRARPRLPGWSPASAPRSAQPLARTPPPASPWPTCVGTRGARISTADSAPGPSSPPPPTCSQGQHRGQSPSPGPAAASERPRIMATEVHNLQELRRSASLATKVFIQRDYSDGTICQFQTKFPPELDSRIERQLFEETVKTLNGFYAEAEKIGGSSYLEGCLACATAYFIFLCMETHYEKVLKKISRYIQEQNEKIFAPRGLLLTDPVERGMRVVSFWAVLCEGTGLPTSRDPGEAARKQGLHSRFSREPPHSNGP